MFYDGQYNEAARIEKALTIHGFVFKQGKTKKGGKFGDEYYFQIDCNGIQDAAIVYVIIGGSPKDNFA